MRSHLNIGLQRGRRANRLSKDPQANGTRSGPPTTKEAPYPRGTSYDRATNETKWHCLLRHNHPPVLLTRLETEWTGPSTTVVLQIPIPQSQSTRAINNGTTARLMRLSLAPYWRLKGAEPLSLTRAPSVPNAVLPIDFRQTSRELVPRGRCENFETRELE